MYIMTFLHNLFVAQGGCEYLKFMSDVVIYTDYIIPVSTYLVGSAFQLPLCIVSFSSTVCNTLQVCNNIVFWLRIIYVESPLLTSFS